MDIFRMPLQNMAKLPTILAVLSVAFSRINGLNLLTVGCQLNFDVKRLPCQTPVENVQFTIHGHACSTLYLGNGLYNVSVPCSNINYLSPIFNGHQIPPAFWHTDRINALLIDNQDETNFTFKTRLALRSQCHTTELDRASVTFPDNNNNKITRLRDNKFNLEYCIRPIQVTLRAGNHDTKVIELSADTVEVELKCSANEAYVEWFWGPWSEISVCSTSCGLGTATRYRKCISRAVQPQELDCRGPDKETTKCFLQSCPVDGQWSTWLSWTECFLPGSGNVIIRTSRTRVRVCNNPQPSSGGIACIGESLDTLSCGCKPLNTLAHTQVYPNDHSTGAIVMVACDDGFELTGTGKLFCSITGLWMDALTKRANFPICIPKILGSLGNFPGVVANGNKFYLFVEEQLSWADALDYCERRAGTLLYIDSEAELNWIGTQLPSSYYFIGAVESGGQYVWYYSGAPVQESLFGAGQPDDNLRCIGLWNAINYRLDDTYCDSVHSFICKSI